MKFKGGYNVLLQGRPTSIVERLPEPEQLYIPLQSQRFSFSDICVENGENVNGGDVLAKDSDNYSVPLLAPRGGKVNYKDGDKQIILTDLMPSAGKYHIPEKDFPHIVQEMGAAGAKRYKLLSLGAWQFFYDAYTNQLPDPMGTPQAVIVSTLNLEPFLVRGDAQLHNRLLQFTRGLEHLQSLLEYQPIYLILPDIKSPFALQVREHIRGYAWAKLIQVPMKYPYDNFNILSRALKLKKSSGPIWSVRTNGILAVDRALTVSRPCFVRIISISGPAVTSPCHLKAIVGYPIQKILGKYITEPDVRVINGGLLTGEPTSKKISGLDTEAQGLTVVPELKEREFLGFLRPGFNRKSYSKCFLSTLRLQFSERLNTAVRGEGRPCVSCNFCDEVCPADIMPHLLHKYLYRGLIEEVEQARVDLCVECGLCSYVCPSKIELREEFIKAKELIENEKEEIRQEQLKEQLQESGQ